MHALKQYRSPVDHHAADHIVLKDDIFDRVAVEDSSAGMHSLIEQSRCTFDRIHHKEVVAILLIVDAKFLDDVQCFLLHDDVVEHHRTAPHATTRRQFSIKLCHFQPCLGKIVSCYDARRATTYDSYIEVQITLQLLEIRGDNTLRN